MEIVVGILLVLALVLIYIVFNLYRKVTKQEDILEYQVEYLRKVSYLIQESKLYIEQLDQSGAFQADDELGVFFNFMKEIQDTINTYRLPQDYGKTTE
jgi:hypothetical protein